MGHPIITVEGLGKKYLLTHQRREPYTALRDVMSEKAKALGHRLVHPLSGTQSPVSNPGQEEFWALRDVSFDVNQGDRVGIIGRNGAGKSTLLKILSRITEPTEGRVRIIGRMASLLEVGTGFHPELTGRENIFLNGAILGMTKAEIRRKFDEIVDFAEVEKFLDTPVKRYSSGMYVRLAFAVAAHLEPEILVVDEVLAVGDAAFQKKCLGKMEEVGKGGRTVLFVSHNMSAIRNLCDWVVLLKDGKTDRIGKTLAVTENYLQQNLRADSYSNIYSTIMSLPSDPIFRLESIKILQNGESGNTVLNGEPVEIEIRYCVLQRTIGLRVYFDLCDEEGKILIRSFHDDDAEKISTVEPGTYCSCATIPADLLAPRLYDLRIYGTIFNVRNMPPGGIGIPLNVEKNNRINRAYPLEPIRAKLLPKIHWHTEVS